MLLTPSEISNINSILFILGIDLTIGLIHIIAQQTQKIRLYRCYRNVLPTEKSLVVSFWTFFKFLSNQGELERTETNKNYVHARVSF